MYTSLINAEILRTVKPVSEFNTLIKRERNRSDRNNRKFSLVTFNVAEQEKKNTEPSNFVNVLSSRLRVSDEIGWLDEQQIAVLLPETTIDGANSLVNSLSENSLHTGPVPKYNTYMYPSIKWNNRENDSGQSFQKDDVHEKFAVGHKIPVWKRTIDILGSSLGLLLLSPVLLFVAALIKFVSPGSVFFKQERVGRSGKIFTLFKFRTMKENNDSTVHREYLKELINGDSDEEKSMIKLDNDSRIIPMGNILRSTCLDELPQLINVLRGDMSLIGPRPPILYEADEYLRWHTRRFDITPGLTGLWQVSGKNRTTFKEMIRLDIKYVAERSFWLDLKILLKTPLVVLSQIQESLSQIIRRPLTGSKVAKEAGYCIDC